MEVPMSRLAVVPALIVLTLVVAAGTQPGLGGQSQPIDTEGGSLQLHRFASARAFQRYLESAARARPANASMDVSMDAAEPPPPAITAPVALPSVQFEPSAGQASNPAITNNQTIGVDEGGIVKQIGRFLVVLQDGRLFSADIGEGEGAHLRLADRVDVYRSPASAASWYDEMLVLGDRILVTAYNYNEMASEITVLRLGPTGRLTREGRFLLSSNDYYSTDNYATRLVGDTLVFYAPLALEARGPDGRFRWPRLRRADGDGEAGEGEALLGPTDVYAPPGRVDWPVLHTISVCPLRRSIDCRTTAFIGPAMREIYVSTTDAFLWVGAPDGLPWSIDYANQRRQACPAGQSWNDRAGEAAMLYRVPLDGGAIGAVAADGVPADQFAFDSRDGRLRALLSRAPAGCAKPEGEIRLALLDIPLSGFATTIRRVPPDAYAGLPPIAAGTLENRFVGDWLVYGGRSGWSGLPGEEGSASQGRSSLIAVPLARPAEATRLNLPHNAIRIERAGGDAVVTGYRDSSGLSLSYIALGRGVPRVAATTLLPRRFESEGRSHAFNAWIRADGSGLIGLPTTERVRRAGRGWSDSESSALSFIAVAPDKALTSAGALAPRGRGEHASGYACAVSCVDWYGNSRPIFTGGRIFALMGTDLVEGRMAGGRIGEIGRVDLTAPPAARTAAR
jgi:hypothetical protein